MVSACVQIDAGDAGVVFRAWPSSSGDLIRVEFISAEVGQSVVASLSASRAAWREFLADFTAEIELGDRKKGGCEP